VPSDHTTDFPDGNLPANDDGPPSDGHVNDHVGHGHSHGAPLGPTSKKVRRILFILVVPLVLAAVIGTAVLWPDGTNRRTGPANESTARALLSAKVTDSARTLCSTIEIEIETDPAYCDQISIALSDGTRGSFQNPATNGFSIRKGDSIYVDAFAVDDSAGNSKTIYGFYEFKREKPLAALLALFVVVALVVGRSRGLRALVALSLSLVVLGFFMLPAIADGRSPLPVALVGSSLVMFIALYLSHGVNVRTTSAVIGTIVSLTITGVLAAVAVSAARFTGLGEESGFLRATSRNIDLRGLLLAGIIIGALGVLDDVTITQSSAVWELHQANPSLGFIGVYNAAMRIGRDHIASAVNTLVLAYAGASLPLLLLFTQVGTPFGELFNGEPVATEIVRMLAGSIGLMASVPITTALTALVVSTDRAPANDGDTSRWSGRRRSSQSVGPKEFVRPAQEQSFREGSQ
jgi:uncharacterized membrane protein